MTKRRYTRNPEIIEAEAKRATEILVLYASGKTLAEIGAVFSITGVRVRQILDGEGFAGMGGVRKRAADRKRAWEETVKPEWGCTRLQYRALSKMEGRPTHAFWRQKCNAANRGIDWQLTLWDWWTIWQASGRWSQRGCGAEKYAMCRSGDAGPYAVGNVYIATNSENAKDRIRNYGPIRRAAA